MGLSSFTSRSTPRLTSLDSRNERIRFTLTNILWHSSRINLGLLKRDSWAQPWYQCLAYTNLLLPVCVKNHRSHEQRKQPSVCILLDKCIAMWATNSIRETSSLFTPGQLWRHSMEQRGLSNAVSLYTPARAVHWTCESSSVRWSCWHGLGESQRRVSPVQVQCNQRINNRPLNPTDPTDYRDSLRYEWFTPTSQELSSSIFKFVRLSVSLSGIGDTRQNLNIFINFRGQYHQC